MCMIKTKCDNYILKDKYKKHLVAKYDFNDDDNICKDISGNNNNGIYTGSKKVIIDNKIFRDFTSNDYVEFNNVIIPTYEKSIKFDLILPNGGNYYTWFIANTRNTNNSGVIIQNNENVLTFISVKNSNSSNTWNYYIDIPNINYEEPMTILMTYDCNKCKIFINDLLNYVIFDVPKIEDEPYNNNLEINARGWAGRGNFKISNLEIYDTSIEFQKYFYILLKQNGNYYSINEDNYGNMKFKKLNINNLLLEEDFKKYGFNDLDKIYNIINEKNPIIPINILKLMENGKFDILIKELE